MQNKSLSPLKTLKSLKSPKRQQKIGIIPANKMKVSKSLPRIKVIDTKTRPT